VSLIAPIGARRGTGPAPALATYGLRKRYGGLTAVDGVDLEVEPGEFFGLLGPNGAGKTTTIGMLTTRVVPTSGTALVHGVDVAEHPARAKQLIGVVPQTNTLDRSINVAENLYYHGRYFGLRRQEARRRTSEALERFRLTDKAEEKVDTLSGGMAQRLMVARALLHDPAVLFLDEPTTGLDPQSRIALWDLLRTCHAGGQTILLTTHYMEEAEQLCDRVAIMDHGRILAVDEPAALKRSVESATVIRLTVDGPPGSDGSTEDLERLAHICTQVTGVVRADVHELSVRVFAHESRGVLPRVVAAADLEGLDLSDVQITEPTLETVFITLTGRDLRE
jgi:ABC-2 type transport system ATP-binding protein